MLILSLDHQYANNLIDGLITVVVKKEFPKNVKSGTRMYIRTADSIIGECEIKSIEELPIDKLWPKVINKSMLGWEEFQTYFDGFTTGIAITVIKPCRYDFADKLMLIERL